MQILSRNFIFISREQSDKVPYYSNFMRKIVQKFLKMVWTLGKASTVDSSLVTKGKEKLFGRPNMSISVS